MGTRNLLIRGGRLLLGADSEALIEADILVKDGLITEIGPEIVWRGDTIDVDGDFVIPGLINAHVHSPGNFMRGTLEGMPLEVFMLYEVPPLAEGQEDPEIVRLRTLIGAAEMLKVGITSVLDDAFFVPLTTRTAIDAIAGAYAEIGIRATLALDQPLVIEYEKYPFLKDLLPPPVVAAMEAAPRETFEGMMSHYTHLISRWHGAENGRIAAAVSCSAPQRATTEYLRALHDLAVEHDLPFFCHILETKLQRVLGEENYGQSLVQYVDELGILDAHMQVIHAIWIDAADIDVLRRSGATVAHNPVCNLRLGSGVMPFRALKTAGVPLCLGTDEAISDDSHNLWAAMKTAGIVHALSDSDSRNWPRSEEILSAVWDGGSRVMRRAEPVGRIAVGARADFAILDKDADSFRPLHDIRRALVLCESGRSVKHTLVDGVIVVRDGMLTTIDEAALLSELRAHEPHLRQQAIAVRESASELEPFYREMVAMAATRDVGFSRWAGR